MSESNRIAALMQQKSSPLIMGVINVSPDSFFSAKQDFSAAMFAIEKMVAAGVDIIDIGGEATSPKISVGNVSLQAEYDLVLPVVEQARANFPVAISVDTSKLEIMRDALAAGADLINDQRALHADGAIELLAETKAYACIMHSFTDNRVPGSSTPQELLMHIAEALTQRVAACKKSRHKGRKIIC